MYNQVASNQRKSMLLVVLFMAFLGLVGYMLGKSSALGPWGGLTIALGISLVSASISYFAGDTMTLWASGARPTSATDNPYVYRMVENLCIAGGLPMPRVYLIQDPAPNAFATGRDPAHASVAVTTGLLEQLNNEELEGVLAHELSHIKNYDIRFMMLVAVLLGTTLILRDMVFRGALMPKRGSRGDQKGNAVFLVLALVLTILAPLIAELIKLAISRRREYLADASGALLTRYPEGLASALEKIAAFPGALMRSSAATAHLYIASPQGGALRRSMVSLFSTHPPIAERVKLLREMTV